jgi:arylamine N-acetyltransferase
MSGKVSRARLLQIAARLRAGESLTENEREIVVRELERSAADGEPGKRGRPKDTPFERFMRKARCCYVSENIYEGTFPKSLCPEELREVVLRAKGSRTRSDAAAAQILHTSPSTVEKTGSAILIPSNRQTGTEWRNLKPF